MAFSSGLFEVVIHSKVLKTSHQDFLFKPSPRIRDWHDFDRIIISAN